MTKEHRGQPDDRPRAGCRCQHGDDRVRAGRLADFDAFFVSGALEPPGRVDVEAEGASRTGDVRIAGCPTCWGWTEGGRDRPRRERDLRARHGEGGRRVRRRSALPRETTPVGGPDSRVHAAQRISFPASGGTGAVGAQEPSVPPLRGVARHHRDRRPRLGARTSTGCDLGATAGGRAHAHRSGRSRPDPRDRRAAAGRAAAGPSGQVTSRSATTWVAAPPTCAGGGRAEPDRRLLLRRTAGRRRFVTTQQYDGACRYAARDGDLRAAGTADAAPAVRLRRPARVHRAARRDRPDGPVTTSMMVPADRPTVRGAARADGEKRMMLVPFDNDAWVRYETPAIRDVTPAQRSFEVTAFFDDAGPARPGGRLLGPRHRGSPASWPTGTPRRPGPAAGRAPASPTGATTTATG